MKDYDTDAANLKKIHSIHNHPMLESKLSLDRRHVIIDVEVYNKYFALENRPAAQATEQKNPFLKATRTLTILTKSRLNLTMTRTKRSKLLLPNQEKQIFLTLNLKNTLTINKKQDT